MSRTLYTQPPAPGRRLKRLNRCADTTSHNYVIAQQKWLQLKRKRQGGQSLMLPIYTLLSIQNTNPDCYRFFKVTDYLYVFGLIFHILMIPIMLYLNADVVARYNIISILTAFGCIIINRKGLHATAFALFYIDINVHAFIATHYLGWEVGFYHYILLLAPLTFFNPLWSMAVKLLSSSIIVVSFTTLFNTYHEMMYGQILYNTAAGHILFYSNILIMVILYSAIGYYYSQAADDNEDKLRTAQKEAEWIAHTDPLTHIGNRRAMSREILREVNRSQRTQDSFIIALCDIDNFKSLNDEYGHEYGDYVLVSTANLLSNNIRQHDFVARWGGEEFMILLTNTKLEEGMKIIDRLRQNIAAFHHHYKGREYPGITMTFGLCLYDNRLDITDCINGADKALYEGKHMGKNRTMIYDNRNDVCQGIA